MNAGKTVFILFYCELHCCGIQSGRYPLNLCLFEISWKKMCQYHDMFIDSRCVTKLTLLQIGISRPSLSRAPEPIKFIDRALAVFASSEDELATRCWRSYMVCDVHLASQRLEREEAVSPVRTAGRRSKSEFEPESDPNLRPVDMVMLDVTRA